ncbi:hypothetical protein PI124_g20489 [Phytophthora idaei]|nr:hypothetical protein PI125_g23255 [Phytophthora idaei]KAG3128802.1 hypothetical protein PI126_g21233 [Phytophthora idaei]KAG3234457.1 hypothetical protein PI124_g20489 [Phytophthora idaei]
MSHLDGVPGYQLQNLWRLKQNRLRLWGGTVRGFSCGGDHCKDAKDRGVQHLVWTCPDAQRFWRHLLPNWGLQTKEDNDLESQIHDIFTLRLGNTPAWLHEWAAVQPGLDWDCLDKILTAMWTLGCAATVTNIWRWNVDRVHNTDVVMTVDGELAKQQTMLTDTLLRFTEGLSPLTAINKQDIEIAQLLPGESGNGWQLPRNHQEPESFELDSLTVAHEANLGQKEVAQWSWNMITRRTHADQCG